MNQQRVTRFAVLMLVLGLHLLFLLTLSGGRRAEPPAPEPEAMIFLDLPRPVIEQPPAQQPHTPRAALRRGSAGPTQPRRPQAPGPAPAAITPGPAQPAVDWRREGEIAADAQAVEGVRRQQRECEEARQLGKFPPGCPRRSYDPHWQPQEKRAGFIGIIPYVRLGRRCIVGLGFFGCTLDSKPPDPDGTLLNDMSDPSRPTSSVPQLNNTPAEAPRPQAFKPQ